MPQIVIDQERCNHCGDRVCYGKGDRKERPESEYHAERSDNKCDGE